MDKKRDLVSSCFNLIEDSVKDANACSISHVDPVFHRHAACKWKRLQELFLDGNLATEEMIRSYPGLIPEFQPIVLAAQVHQDLPDLQNRPS
jgi:hypothetical protein